MDKIEFHLELFERPSISAPDFMFTEVKNGGINSNKNSCTRL